MEVLKNLNVKIMSHALKNLETWLLIKDMQTAPRECRMSHGTFEPFYMRKDRNLKRKNTATGFLGIYYIILFISLQSIY